MMSQIYLREGEIGGPKDFKKGSLSLAFRRLGCDLEISLIQSIGFYNQTFERKLGRGEGRFVSVFLNASQHQNWLHSPIKAQKSRGWRRSCFVEVWKESDIAQLEHAHSCAISLSHPLAVLTRHGFYLSDEQGLFFWKFMFKNTIIDIDMTGPGHYCHAASSPCEDIMPLISNLTYVNVFGRNLTVPHTTYLDKLYTEQWRKPLKKYKPPCLGYTYNCWFFGSAVSMDQHSLNHLVWLWDETNCQTCH